MKIESIVIIIKEIKIQNIILNSVKYDIINSIIKARDIAITATKRSVSLKYLLFLYLLVINKIAGIINTTEKKAL